MDVHRARFVPFPTPEISAVAFSRSSDDGLSSGHIKPALKLAVGRVNGDVEIWDPLDGKWVQESVFPGDERSIDGLLWTREPDETDHEGNLILGQHRLFSTTASPAVTEWDLEVGMPKRQSTGNFSEVWCFAAQPRIQWDKNTQDQDRRSQDIIAGCEDGSLVLLSTTDNDLQYKRTLARPSGKKVRCMSIVYQTRDRVVAGFADSTIRVYSTTNGANIRVMSLGAGVPGAPKDTLVWKIRCLPNGDIASGDSNGEVKIWDGRSYSLAQRIRGHETDCVELVVGAKGDAIFSGGLDGRLAIYRRSTNAAGRQTWAKGHHRKLHDGDMKSLAAYDSDRMSVIVSGGSEAAPMVVPLREYGKERHRILPALPYCPPVTTARRGRLLVSWSGNNIRIWHMFRSRPLNHAIEPQQGRRLVARIALGTNHKIRSVSISDDGRVLVASTSVEVKVFQLRRRLSSVSLSVRKLVMPTAADGSRLVKVSPDGKWLALATFENEVEMFRLAPIPSDPKKLHVLDRAVELERQDRKDSPHSGFDAYQRCINRLEFSSDSSVLAASDLSGYIDTWVLKGNEDPAARPVEVDDDSHSSSSGGGSDSDTSADADATIIFYGQHWADNPASHLLPRLESAPLVLTFRPPPPDASSSSQHHLATGNPGVHATRHHPHAHSHALPPGRHALWVMTATHEMYEFDVLAGRRTAWSRRNPTAVLPADFTKLHDRVVGAVWDVTGQRERLWLYGASWMFMLNVHESVALAGMDGALGGKKRGVSGERGTNKKRKVVEGSSGAGDKISPAYKDALPEAARRRDGLGAWTALDLDQPAGAVGKGEYAAEDDEDDGIRDGDLQLRLMRLKSEEESPQKQQMVNGDGAVVPSQAPERKWWFLFKYRPILGVAPLEDEDETNEEDQPLEVVVVERPQWET